MGILTQNQWLLIVLSFQPHRRLNQRTATDFFAAIAGAEDSETIDDSDNQALDSFVHTAVQGFLIENQGLDRHSGSFRRLCLRRSLAVDISLSNSSKQPLPNSLLNFTTNGKLQKFYAYIPIFTNKNTTNLKIQIDYCYINFGKTILGKME